MNQNAGNKRVLFIKKKYQHCPVRQQLKATFLKSGPFNLVIIVDNHRHQQNVSPVNKMSMC